MSKRLNLTLPDDYYNALKRWANSDHREPGNLAASVLLKRLDKAIESGEIPRQEEDEDITKLFLLSLIRNKRPKKSEIEELAHDLNIPEEKVIELCDRFFSKENASNSKKT